MKTIEFVRFNPHLDTSLLEELVDCYREVFGEEPWNEWKKCSICGIKWGIGERETLAVLNSEHCGVPVVDFWPRDVVKKDIFHEINPDASCWLTVEIDSNVPKKKVVGFCWGYPVGLEELEKKLSLPGLRKSVIRKFGNMDGKIAYQDELGLIGSYRGRKIAKKMFALRLKDFLSQNLEVGLIRTKTNPPTVTYLWFIRIGYEVVAEYNDSDGRVVLARSYKDFGRLFDID